LKESLGRKDGRVEKTKVGPALSQLALAALVVAGSGACATATYRVPGLEVQRLASLPPPARGSGIRVVPETAPLYPSTQVPAPPPPPVVAPPPGPPAYDPGVVVAADPQPPAVVVEPGVYVDVEVPIGGGHPRVAPQPRVIEGRPPAAVAPPPARAGFVGRPVSSGGGFRGSPPAAAAPTGSGWRGSPVASAPRASVPKSSGGGGHHGGGGGGSNAAAAAGAAVAIVGLIAIAAVAADDAAKADHARKFDGWVNVDPSHPLVLHYRNRYERRVRLSDLQPNDTIGVEYGVLEADDDVEEVKPPPAARAPAR
jgi:hypothetical protein